MLRAEDRAQDGRDREPTAAVVDSSSVKGTPVPGERGFDGAKKVDGIKRHILVDTAGRLLAVHSTAANVQDRAAFGDLLDQEPMPVRGARVGRQGLHGPSTCPGRRQRRDQA